MEQTMLEFIPVHFSNGDRACLSLETCRNIQNCHDVKDLDSVIISGERLVVRVASDFVVTCSSQNFSRADILKRVGCCCVARQTIRNDPNALNYEIAHLILDRSDHSVTVITTPTLL
jgi:hypothetical protein